MFGTGIGEREWESMVRQRVLDAVRDVEEPLKEIRNEMTDEEPDMFLMEGQVATAKRALDRLLEVIRQET